MELYIYSPDIEQLGVIDGFSSLRWRRRYFEPGEFELHVPATNSNLSLLKEGNILHRLDRQEAGIIEGVLITEIESGDEITVTGRMGSSLLDSRIITPTINFSGTTEVAMQKIVSDNAITSRSIPYLAPGELAGFTQACSFQATGKNVLTVSQALGKAALLGFRVRLSVPDKAWIFEVYQGTDKSVSQTDRPYVLFSDEFQNISSPQYSLNSVSYKNFAYVAGEGEGESRVIITVDQTNGRPRKEMWVDARDLQKGDLTDEEYYAQLTQRGLEKLAEAARVESLEAVAVNAVNFAYLTDWDLGDVVSFEKWGVLLNQRITEVEEVFENGIMTVMPTCGTPLPEKLDLGSDT